MVTKQLFGNLLGRDIHRYTLSDGIVAQVVTCGATLVSLQVPSNTGKLVDVALGLQTPQDIVASQAYMGSVVGRCANRIDFGRFRLNGQTYNLAQNNGKAHLHGGNVGFNQKVYDATLVDNSLILSAFSPDGEENYPANLDYCVKYTVSGTTLTIEYFATADGDTIFNPTCHAYFNLGGDGSGSQSVYDTVVQIFADSFLPIDENLIPTGELRPVADTPFDFSQPKPIGRDIGAADSQLAIAHGYDHNFCLKQRHCATAYLPATGIVVDCLTDMPGMQFYTGNFLQENGKHHYGKRDGFCFETQFFPDAINKSDFVQPVLKKGQQFYSKTQYVFSVK